LAEITGVAPLLALSWKWPAERTTPFHSAYAAGGRIFILTACGETPIDAQRLKARCYEVHFAARLNRLRKKYIPRRSLTSAAKAGPENKPVTAAVNRCATQNQVRDRLLRHA
jgi:hypothetical protein